MSWRKSSGGGAIDLRRDPVGHVLFRQSVPTTIGVMAVILYFLADTYFVSLLGTRELAALSFTFPATIFVTYFGVGLGIGTSALVARAIGGNDHEGAAQLTMASLSLAIVIGLLLIVPGLLSIGWLFDSLGADSDLQILIREFMSVWLCGVPFLLFQFAGTAVLRAQGNNRLHGILMSAGAVMNCVLDPIFIFGFGPIPACGIAGAAIATVATWAVTVLIVCYVLTINSGLLQWQRPEWHTVTSAWTRHLRITVPAAMANMMTPVAAAVITATLAEYGPHVVAGYGVATRVEGFAMIVVLGMSMSLPPFISQNLGGGLLDRVRAALKLSLGFVLVWQAFVYVVIAVSAPYIARLFTSDEVVGHVIRTVLVILPASYAFQGMVVLTASSFNALHAPRNAFITSFMRFFVFFIPAALIGEHLGGVSGLFIGAACGNVLAGLTVARWIMQYVSSERVQIIR